MTQKALESPWRSDRRLSLRGCVSFFFLAGSMWPLGSVAGQEARPPTDRPRVCSIVERPGSEETARQVLAGCWGTSLMLGTAGGIRSFASRELEATVVELEEHGEKRVLLLRPDEAGRPLIENIGGMLAVAAGRNPWTADLSGLTFDYAQFAEAGSIGVESDGTQVAARSETASDTGETPAGAFVVRIDEHIALNGGHASATGTEQAQEQ